MEVDKATTPRRGGAGRLEAETANPQPESQSDSDQDYDTGANAGLPHTWTTTVRAQTKGKRFDNDPKYRVHRHRKTTYSYRIGIRLPKEKLQQFPRYDGKVKEFRTRWNGTFLTFKFPPAKLRSFLLARQRALPSVASFDTAASSLPSLPSTDPSSLSGADVDPRTPCLLPKEDLVSPHFRALQQELLRATTGSFGVCEQQGPFPPTASSSLNSPIPFTNLGTTFEDLPVSERLIRNSTMAPVRDTSAVHDTIRDVVQDLTEVQFLTQGYVPDTQALLVDKLTDLTKSLAELKRLSSPTESPNNYIHQVAIAPEIVDYVDDGRNPDIFTRDFVENVQRGNAVVNGKQQAFRSFTEIYAQKLKEGIPGVSGQVDRVMRNAGFDAQEQERTNGADRDERHAGGNGAGPSNG